MTADLGRRERQTANQAKEGSVDILYVLVLDDRATFFTKKGKRYTCNKWNGNETEALNNAIDDLQFNGTMAFMVYEGDNISLGETDVPAGVGEKHILQFLKRKNGLKQQEKLIGYRFHQQNRKAFFDAMDYNYYKKLRNIFFECGLSLELIVSLPSAMEAVANNLKQRAKDSAPFILHVTDEGTSSYYLLYYDTETGAPTSFRKAAAAHNEEEATEYFNRNAQIGKHMFGGVVPKIFLLNVWGDDSELVPEDSGLSIEHLDFTAILEGLKNTGKRDGANIVPKQDRDLNKQKTLIIFGWSAIICVVMLIATGIGLLNKDIGELRSKLEKAQIEKDKKTHLTKEALKLSMAKNLHDGLAAAEEPALLRALIIVGNITPDRAVLRKWEASEINGSIVFTIHGEIAPPFNDAAELLEEFQKKLTQPPLEAEITKSWQDGWLRALEESHSGAMIRDAKFTIEGAIK